MAKAVAQLYPGNCGLESYKSYSLRKQYGHPEAIEVNSNLRCKIMLIPIHLFAVRKSLIFRQNKWPRQRQKISKTKCVVNFRVFFNSATKSFKKHKRRVWLKSRWRRFCVSWIGFPWATCLKQTWLKCCVEGYSHEAIIFYCLRLVFCSFSKFQFFVIAHWNAWRKLGV